MLYQYHKDQTGYTIELSHVKQRVDRYSDRHDAHGAYAVASLRYLMSSPRSFSFLMPAKTIFVPARGRVSESPRTITPESRP